MPSPFAYTLAHRLLRHGDLAGVARCYRLALEADPGFALAYNLLGSALLALGCYEEALAALPKGPTGSRRVREGKDTSAMIRLCQKDRSAGC